MPTLLREIQFEIKSIKIAKKEIRNFGFVFATFFLILIYFFKNQWIVFLPISIFLIIAGIFIPELLKKPYILWMSLAIVLGFFIFRLILVILYFLAIIPIGLLSLIFRGDFLNKDFKNKKETYWLKHSRISNPEEPF